MMNMTKIWHSAGLRRALDEVEEIRSQSKQDILENWD